MLVFVLDMDETLIGTGPCTLDPCTGELQCARPIARPYLTRLLASVFANAEDVVGIWTAATRRWFIAVYRLVLAPALRRCSALLGRRCRLAFAYTREHCTPRNEHCIKKLRKMWRRGAHGATPDNTIVLDDSSRTFVCNYGNAVLVPEFRPVARTAHELAPGVTIRVYSEQHDNDSVLLALSFYIDILRDVHRVAGTVRRLDKRAWLSNTRLWAGLDDDDDDDDSL